MISSRFPRRCSLFERVPRRFAASQLTTLTGIACKPLAAAARPRARTTCCRLRAPSARPRPLKTRAPPERTQTPLPPPSGISLVQLITPHERQNISCLSSAKFSVFELASCWLWFSSVGHIKAPSVIYLCSKQAIYPAKSSCRHHSRVFSESPIEIEGGTG
jgi:hypothetical protein